MLEKASPADVSVVPPFLVNTSHTPARGHSSGQLPKGLMVKAPVVTTNSEVVARYTTSPSPTAIHRIAAIYDTAKKRRNHGRA